MGAANQRYNTAFYDHGLKKITFAAPERGISLSYPVASKEVAAKSVSQMATSQKTEWVEVGSDQPGMTTWQRKDYVQVLSAINN